MEDLNSIVQWLQATGPYGVLAIIGWLFRRVNERKEKTLQAIYETMAEQTKAQALATAKVHEELVRLRRDLGQEDLDKTLPVLAVVEREGGEGEGEKSR